MMLALIILVSVTLGVSLMNTFLALALLGLLQRKDESHLRRYPRP